MKTMRAMRARAPRAIETAPLELREKPIPEPRAGERDLEDRIRAAAALRIA